MGRKKTGMGDEAFDFGSADPRDRTRDERFADFHREHPEIWAQFKQLAELIYKKGFRRYSPDIIIHLIRWKYDSELGPNSKAVPKVNDWYTGYYADMFRTSDKRYAKFFIKKGAKEP